MRRIRYFTMLLLVLTVPLVACGDDDDGPTGPDLQAQFEGSWTTQSFVYTSVANPAVTAPIHLAGLGIESLDITESGAFTGVLVLPGPDGSPQSQQIAGEVTNVTETSLTIDFVGAVNDAGLEDLDVTYTLESGVLTFESAPGDVDFDFDQDGDGEEATLRITLART